MKQSHSRSSSINFEGDFIKIKLETFEEEDEEEGEEGRGKGKEEMEGEEEEDEYILEASNHNSHLIAISHYNGPDNAWKLFKQNPGVFNHFYC